MPKAVSVEFAALLSSRKVEVVGIDAGDPRSVTLVKAAVTLWHVRQSRFNGALGKHAH